MFTYSADTGAWLRGPLARACSETGCTGAGPGSLSDWWAPSRGRPPASRFGRSFHAHSRCYV